MKYLWHLLVLFEASFHTGGSMAQQEKKEIKTSMDGAFSLDKNLLSQDLSCAQLTP